MNLKLILLAAALVGGFFIAYKIYDAGGDSAENISLKQENKEIKDEAQAYANRPRTNDDLIERLCQWGIERRKSEGGAKQPVPVQCR